MFESLPHHFQQHGLSADVKVLLRLRKAMDRGLVNTLGDLYMVLKGLIVHDPREMGPYTIAFYDYFLSIEVKPNTNLKTSVQKSEVFREWLANQVEEEVEVDDLNLDEWVEKFLDEVHITTLDIQKVIDGAELLKKDDPNHFDLNPEDEMRNIEQLDQATDYRNVSLEELKERLKKIQEQQKGFHSGGNHWIGNGGQSPFGFNGAALGGMRIGGGGGGKMARAVIGDPNYYPLDTKQTLKDDQIDVALTLLKGIEEESAEEILDIPETIKRGLKQGGIFLPYQREEISQKVQVILLVDNGGMSMLPYVKIVTKLFSKMKTRFSHDLKTYYFHNTIYDGAYSDERRKNFESVDKINLHHKNYSVFVIGDADMAPYELGQGSIRDWEKLKSRFSRIAWLNPMPQKYWAVSDTLPLLKRIIPMYPLSADGIEQAILEMNRKRQYSKL